MTPVSVTAPPAPAAPAGARPAGRASSGADGGDFASVLRREDRGQDVRRGAEASRNARPAVGAASSAGTTRPAEGTPAGTTRSSAPAQPSGTAQPPAGATPADQAPVVPVDGSVPPDAAAPAPESPALAPTAVPSDAGVAGALDDAAVPVDQDAPSEEPDAAPDASAALAGRILPGVSAPAGPETADPSAIVTGQPSATDAPAGRPAGSAAGSAAAEGPSTVAQAMDPAPATPATVPVGQVATQAASAAGAVQAAGAAPTSSAGAAEAPAAGQAEVRPGVTPAPGRAVDPAPTAPAASDDAPPAPAATETAPAAIRLAPVAGTTAPDPSAAPVPVPSIAATSAPTPVQAPTPASAGQPAVPVQQPLAPQLTAPLAALRQAPEGQHVMILRVEPEAMGPVQVRAQIGAEGVRIELVGATDQAREALRVALSDLRRDLAATGLRADLSLGSQQGQGFGEAPSWDGAGRGASRPEGARVPGARLADAPTETLAEPAPPTTRRAGGVDLIV